jgi:uncharacterized Zn-finger protein
MPMPFETIEVMDTQVTCDGGGGALGHPKVYLHIDADAGNSITCPYCSRMYVLKQPSSHQSSAA